MTPLLAVEEVSVAYTLATGLLRARRQTLAVDRVSFTVESGRTLGVVGESGCGKSSLGRALAGLEPLAHGGIRLHGRVVAAPGQPRALAPGEVQFVFQDPAASLDPRMTAGDSIAEPLDCGTPGLAPVDRRRRIEALLAAVGLDAQYADRYPHQLSGGQCQRVAIARALSADPRLVVCDEPVSALDVSVQGQVVNLLMDLQRSRGLALVFISHDLAIVRHVSHDVLVLYRGQPVERAPTEVVYAGPLHPYTRALLDAVPTDGPLHARGARGTAPAALPALAAPPRGCTYADRCVFASARCRNEAPRPAEAQAGRWVACHRWQEWPDGVPSR